MNLETVDVTQLRALVARNEDYLRTHPDTQQARGRALSVAASITGDHSPLVQKARQLPPAQSLVPPHGVSSPLARDDRFDAAMKELIADFHLTIDQIEDFQQRLKANATDQPQQSSSLAWTLGLPYLRARDALEYLDHQGAIDINELSRTAVDDFLFTVTFQGRRLARNPVKPRAALAPVRFTQHFYHSNIANAGVALGPVEQHFTINPDVREIVDALTEFYTAIADDPSTADAGTFAQSAAHELRTNGWSDKAAAFLRAIPGALGNVTAFAAHVKPAYDLVRSLVDPLGVTWPPLL